VADLDRIELFDLPRPEREEILSRMARAASRLDGVDLVVVHGSFLEEGRFRDLDVAVLFEEPMSWRSLGPVEGALRTALPSELGLPLEVLPLNDAAPHFRAEVLERGRILYERESRLGLEAWVRAKSESLDFDAWRRAHGVPPW
jgi:uncharacterized protein